MYLTPTAIFKPVYLTRFLVEIRIIRDASITNRNLVVLIANDPGATVSVPYQENEPVFCLLDRISDILGENLIDPYCRKLYLNAVRLKDLRKLMKSCRIFGNYLTYRSDALFPAIFYVKTLTNRTIELPYQPWKSVKNIKRMIQSREGIPADQQKLIYDGKELEESGSLEEYNIRQRAALHLVLRLRGGANPLGLVFSDVSDATRMPICGFSDSAPPGRVTFPGANIECLCECTRSHRVVCPVGFGPFEVSEDLFTCPNCRESHWIVPHNWIHELQVSLPRDQGFRRAIYLRVDRCHPGRLQDF